jgi:hypothetical protein
MHPEIWGPHAWIFLHSISLNYPENPSELDKERYRNFFSNLQYILPCEKCAYNYGIKLKSNPIELDSKSELIEWLIKIHNIVNESNGKKKISNDEFMKIYQNIYNNQSKPKKIEKIENKPQKIGSKKNIFNNNSLTIILIIIIMVLLFSLKKKY